MKNLFSDILLLFEMERPKKQWKNKIEGNRYLHSGNNALMFIEKVLPSIALQDYPDRPKEAINCSMGDPTTSLDYRYSFGYVEPSQKIWSISLNALERLMVKPISKGLIVPGKL